MVKTLLLISGKMQSGKNTFADMLESCASSAGTSVTQGLFAKPLKDACSADMSAVFAFLRSERSRLLDTYQEILPEDLAWMDAGEEEWYGRKTPLTRALLQAYGTEIFRNRVGEDYWVDRMADTVRSSPSELFIVTDARFPNELERMRTVLPGHRVLTVRVVRPGYSRELPEHSHPSETALDSYASWDRVVVNDKGLPELGALASDLFSYLSGIGKE